MTWIMVDVEADGPIPHEYSMICVGAIVVEHKLNRTFYGQLKPMSDNYVDSALSVSGFTREQTMEFDNPLEVMQKFHHWVLGVKTDRCMFISDNNGFDWQFVNYYFHHFVGENPFGHSSTNLGSLYKGLVKNMKSNFKYLRKTRHTHNPADDARGNAEALLAMIDQYGLRFPL